MNKNIFHVLLLLLAIGLASCVSEIDVPVTSEGGQLQLSLANISTAVTRSTPHELGAPTAADFHLNLTLKSGHTIYDGVFKEDAIRVPIGEYDITVSYGENATMALDKPYYVGTTTATVVENETTEASVECKVGNALISAVFGKDDAEHERFERFYSDYALYAYIGDKGMAIERLIQDKSIYVQAGSHVTLRFWGKLKMEGDREVSCDLVAKDFPDVLNAADHAIVTLSLPDPESAFTVDISKVEVETVTLDETIPLSWLPVPTATAEHKYVGGKLSGTDLTFSNSYPGMNWKAVVTNAEGTTVRSAQGTGELRSPYTSSSSLPYLPQGRYTATYYLIDESGTATKASSRQFDIPAPTITLTTGGYTSYDKYLEGDVDGANACDGRTVYNASVSLNVASSLLTNSNYSYTFNYTYDGNTTAVAAGLNSYKTTFSDQVPRVDKYVFTATATFDGVTANARRDFTVTGLPYSLNLASHDEWATSSGVDWFEKDVRLGHLSTGSQSITNSTSVCIPTRTYICADYSINVHTLSVGTTFTLTVGDIQMLEKEEGGTPFNDTDHLYSGTTDVFHSDSQYLTTIVCHNSYGAGQTCSHIYSLTLKYAKP